jgi:HK97 family phage major capsid protein
MKVQFTQDYTNKDGTVIKSGFVTRELSEEDARSIMDNGYGVEFTTQPSNEDRVRGIMDKLDVTPDKPKVEMPNIIIPRENDEKTFGYRSFAEFAQDVAKNPGRVASRVGDFTRTIAGANEGTPADGGYLIPPEFATEVMTHMTNDSVLAGRVRQIPMARNTMKVNGSTDYTETASASGMVMHGGVTAVWLDEGAKIDPSKGQFEQISLDLHRAAAFMAATDDMIEDSPVTVSTYFAQQAAQTIGRLVDYSIIRGNGTKKPTGILNSASLATVAKGSGQASGTVTLENVETMYRSMPERYRSGAIWLMDSSVAVALSQLAATNSNLLWQPQGSIANSPFGILKGKPVIETDLCSTIGTSGDILFINPDEYLLGVKSLGLTAATSIHMYFDSFQTAYRFSMRVDGKSAWTQQGEDLNGRKVSPFVALATR